MIEYEVRTPSGGTKWLTEKQLRAYDCYTTGRIRITAESKVELIALCKEAEASLE